MQLNELTNSSKLFLNEEYSAYFTIFIDMLSDTFYGTFKLGSKISKIDYLYNSFRCFYFTYLRTSLWKLRPIPLKQSLKSQVSIYSLFY